MTNPSRFLLPLLAPLVFGLGVLGLGACSSTRAHKAPSEVGDLVRHGRFVEALRLAEEAAQGAPADSDEAKALTYARTAYLMEAGRRATLEDEDEQALELFQLAREVGSGLSDVHVVDSWVDKTRRKLSERWLDTAQEFSAEGELEAALDAFERANVYAPDDERGKKGIAYVLLRMNFREGRGSQYYKEGIAALRDYWLNYAEFKMRAAGKYLEEDEAVARRLEEIRVQKAQERLAVARSFEETGLFFAARNEYRIAQILDPGSADAEAGRRSMENEASADELLREAELQVLKGDLDSALEAVQEARPLTRLQDERVELVTESIRRARYQGLYDDAYELESDGRFEEAIAAYEELLDVSGYYGDAITRKETLEDLVADAKRLYQAYEAATSQEERHSLLRQIALIWPDYGDVQELLDAAGPAVWGDDAEPESGDEPVLDEDAEDESSAGAGSEEEPDEDPGDEGTESDPR
jgi:tetratricopeptide (TPR) repeat protein